MCLSPRHAALLRTRHHCGHRHHCVHRRRRGAYLRLTTRTDSRNYVYSFGNPYSGNMYASTSMRPCTVWLDSELCSCARCGEFTMVRGRCSRHGDASSVSKACSLAVSMFWQAPRRTQNHWHRRRRVVGKTGSDIHAAITWMSAFEGSVVVRREVHVSMCSFCFSSHTQHEVSMQLEAMSTHGTAHLLRKFFASERC